MSAGTRCHAGMLKLIIGFKPKPFVMHDSSIARRSLASFTYTVIQIMTAFITQKEKKNNLSFVHQKPHRFRIFRVEGNTVLACLRGKQHWDASKSKTHQKIKMF